MPGSSGPKCFRGSFGIDSSDMMNGETSLFLSTGYKKMKRKSNCSWLASRHSNVQRGVGGETEPNFGSTAREQRQIEAAFRYKRCRRLGRFKHNPLAAGAVIG